MSQEHIHACQKSDKLTLNKLLENIKYTHEDALALYNRADYENARTLIASISQWDKQIVGNDRNFETLPILSRSHKLMCDILLKAQPTDYKADALHNITTALGYLCEGTSKLGFYTKNIEESAKEEFVKLFSNSIITLHKLQKEYTVKEYTGQLKKPIWYCAKIIEKLHNHTTYTPRTLDNLSTIYTTFIDILTKSNDTEYDIPYYCKQFLEITGIEDPLPYIKTSQAKILHILGEIHLSKGDTEKATNAFRKEISLLIKPSKTITGSNQELAQEYYNYGAYTQAIQFANKLLSSKSKQHTEELSALNILTSCYEKLGNIPQAAVAFGKATKIISGLDINTETASPIILLVQEIYNTGAIIFLRNNDTDKALLYKAKASQLHEILTGQKDQLLLNIEATNTNLQDLKAALSSTAEMERKKAQHVNDLDKSNNTISQLQKQKRRKETSKTKNNATILEEQAILDGLSTDIKEYEKIISSTEALLLRTNSDAETIKIKLQQKQSQASDQNLQLEIQKDKTSQKQHTLQEYIERLSVLIPNSTEDAVLKNIDLNCSRAKKSLKDFEEKAHNLNFDDWVRYSTEELHENPNKPPSDQWVKLSTTKNYKLKLQLTKEFIALLDEYIKLAPNSEKYYNEASFLYSELKNIAILDESYELDEKSYEEKLNLILLINTYKKSIVLNETIQTHKQKLKEDTQKAEKLHKHIQAVLKEVENSNQKVLKLAEEIVTAEQERSRHEKDLADTDKALQPAITEKPRQIEQIKSLEKEKELLKIKKALADRAEALSIYYNHYYSLLSSNSNTIPSVTEVEAIPLPLSYQFTLKIERYYKLLNTASKENIDTLVTELSADNNALPQIAIGDNDMLDFIELQLAKAQAIKATFSTKRTETEFEAPIKSLMLMLESHTTDTQPSKVVSLAYQYLAQIYCTTNNAQKAILFFSKEIDINQTLCPNNYTGEILRKLKLCTLYTQLHNAEEHKKHLDDAIRLLDCHVKKHPQTPLYSMYLDIIEQCIVAKLYTEALDHCTKALSLDNISLGEKFKLLYYKTLSTSHIETKIDDANNCLKEIIKLYEENPNAVAQNDIHGLHCIVSNQYNDMKNKDQAKQYALDSEKYAGTPLQKAESKIALGGCIATLYEQYRYYYDALEILYSSVESKRDNVEVIIILHTWLAKAYLKCSNFVRYAEHALKLWEIVQTSDDQGQRKIAKEILLHAINTKKQAQLKLTQEEFNAIQILNPASEQNPDDGADALIEEAAASTSMALMAETDTHGSVV